MPILICTGKSVCQCTDRQYRAAGTESGRQELAGGTSLFFPVTVFALGVAMAECIRMRYQKAQKIHWRQLVLVMEIVLLFAVGFFPNDIDLLANAMVSFACAMQVQAFRKVNGYAFASTMCIGNLRSGMESLCAYGKTKDKRYCKNPVIISESSSCSPSVRHWEDT